MRSQSDVCVASAAEDRQRGNRAKEALREAAAVFRTLAENAIVGVYALQDGRFYYVNSTMSEIYGRPVEDLLAVPVLDLIHPDDRELVASNIRRRVEGTERSLRYTVRILRKDSSVAYVEAHGIRIVHNGRPAILGVALDITERKKAEVQLQQQAKLIAVAHDAVVVRDLDGRVRYVNPAAEKLFGRSRTELIGANVAELVYHDKGSFDEITKTLLGTGEWSGELRLHGKDGQDVFVFTSCTLMRDDRGSPGSVLAISTDITEKKRLEDQFLRAQRLEMIGTLAGGVAHDLNNVLAPILMATELLHSMLHDEAGQRLIETLSSSAQRGADIIRQILSFARGTVSQRAAVQLKHLIADHVKICKDTFSPSIHVQSRAPTGLWAVMGDATQLYQVLMNLCINARDAMPLGGTLTIGAENVHLDEHYSRMHEDAKPGPHVVITVTDTGSGIPPHIMPKIFEPFFTTKEPGRGTGLGLSTVHSIVKGHGGWVTVYSEAGKGTTFKVYLPAASGQGTEVPSIAQADLPPGHGELVLVVDDEATIRTITQRALEANGYRVLTAGDGTEALAVYAQHPGQVQVVITDMAMPFMDGPATIRALHRLNPDVKILAVSGMLDNTKVASEYEHVKFLRKPFTAVELLTELRHALAGDAVPATEGN